MSFDLKINHLCPHIQTEEAHVCEADGRRVVLNDIAASTSSKSLRVKVNGVEWDRNNMLESPVVFDITDELAGSLSNYQLVLPEVPVMRGDQQGEFAEDDRHVVVRACARERVPLEQLTERPKAFRIGQNDGASAIYIVHSTAHAWGLIRPRLDRATMSLMDYEAILARYDSNPNIEPVDLLKNPDMLRPELERILSPRADLDPWATNEILSRFDADPTMRTYGATVDGEWLPGLLDGLDVPSDIANAVEALIGTGRPDAVFEVDDESRENVYVALGDVGTQLARILDSDASITAAQKSDMLERYDADPSLSAEELLDGFTVLEATTRQVTALLGDGRPAGTRWAEIPVTPRLPLLGRYDFIEGEIVSDDVKAFVNGEPVAVAAVDGFEGIVELFDAPYPCDLVEFEYCWKVKLLFVNGESGVIAVDPHHLADESGNLEIAGADVRYFTRIKDGWSLSPNAGSIGDQLDIVFDTTKRTDKGRVILESLGRYANGFNTVFQTSKAPLLPFDAGFFSNPTETLLNSSPISVGGEIVVPMAFDPILGLIQLDSPPAPGQDVRVSYYYKLASNDPAMDSAVAIGSAPANPFEPDIIEVDYVTRRTNCHRCNAMGRLADTHYSFVDGSIATARAEQKLKQDLYKIVGTVIGSNPFHRFYGTNFTIYIGQSGPPGFFRAQLTNEMISALGALQRLQNDQFTYQAEFIDRRELINAIQSVNVRQVDEIDPGIFQVDVTLLSDAGNVVDARVLLTEEGVTLLDRSQGRELKAIPQ